MKLPSGPIIRERFDHRQGKSPMNRLPVDRDSLPQTVEETHISLFDGTIAALPERQAGLLRQYHLKLQQDSHYLFDRFVSAMGDS